MMKGLDDRISLLRGLQTHLDFLLLLRERLRHPLLLPLSTTGLSTTGFGS